MTKAVVSVLRVAVCAVCLSLPFLGGCASQIYSHQPQVSVNVSPCTSWAITGDHMNNVQWAIDDVLVTAATSDAYYTSAAVTVDLGKPCVFNMVVLDHGIERDGYARRTAVYISMDGKNYQYQYAVPGTRRVTILNWVTPVMARYVRVQAIAPGDRPWSIAELYVQ